MANWDSPAEVQRDAVIANQISMFFFGLYVWEIIVHISFDWSMFSGQRRFRPPALLYFLCRYGLLGALITSLIARDGTSQMNCQALAISASLLGTLAVLSASTLLMLRTIAVWERRTCIVIPLAIFSLSQWALGLFGVSMILASWNEGTRGCVFTSRNPSLMGISIGHTICFDLAVLVLTTVGLYLNPGRSGLWNLLFRDGLAYFFVSFTCHTILVVFGVLRLNYVMEMIFSGPSAVLTCIAACRTFTRLSDYLYTPNSSMASVRHDISTGPVIFVHKCPSIEEPYDKPSYLGRVVEQNSMDLSKSRTSTNRQGQRNHALSPIPEDLEMFQSVELSSSSSSSGSLGSHATTLFAENLP